MNYQSQEVGYGRTFADTILAALKTVPGGALITSGKIRFSKDPAYDPTPASAIADLSAHECDFSGYTSGGYATTLSAPLNLSTVCGGVQCSALAIAGTASPFVPNTVYGYWLDDGTNVIAFERFAGGASMSIAAPGDFIDLQVFLPLQLAQATQ